MARVANANVAAADKYIKTVLEAQAKDWGNPLLNHLIYARRPVDLQRRASDVDRHRCFRTN